jgi:hypothetical protein
MAYPYHCHGHVPSSGFREGFLKLKITKSAGGGEIFGNLRHNKVQNQSMIDLEIFEHN